MQVNNIKEIIGLKEPANELPERLTSLLRHWLICDNTSGSVTEFYCRPEPDFD